MNSTEQISNDRLSIFQRGRHIAVIIALLVGGVGSMKALYAYDLHQHQKKNEEYANELFSSVKFNDYFNSIECKKEELDAKSLLSTTMNEEIDATIYPENIDLSKPGTKQVDFLLKYKDDLGTVHRDILTKKITLRDTVKPEIEVSSDTISLWQYASFSAADYISSIQDEVDGLLEFADELSPGKYTISSDVNSNVPGDYTVTIKAQDLSGNESEKSLAVAVHQQPVAQPTYSAASNNVGYTNAYSGYSGGYSGGYTDYSYSAPSYAYSNGTNFDAYWGVSHGDDAQGIVDAGGIAAIGNDYFHHNTSDFMNQFWGTQAGDTVTIDGTTYTCTGIEHGYVGNDGATIYSDSGQDVYLDGNANLITCDGAPGTDQRWIMYLEEQP